MRIGIVGLLAVGCSEPEPTEGEAEVHGEVAEQEAPKAPASTASGSLTLADGRQVVVQGAVRFEDQNREGAPVLALTSQADPSCGLIDWGDGATETWWVLAIDAPGGEQLLVYEGQPMEDERWGLRLVERTPARIDGSAVVVGESRLDFQARDCGPGRL